MNRPIRLFFAVTLLMFTPFASADSVLITGSNSGIGLEFARQYAALGWDVIATHRRDSVPETLRELQSRFDTVRVEKMDVTDPEQIASLAKKLEGSAIDVLINNAGLVQLGDRDDSQSFGSLNYAHFDAIVATNVKAPIMVCEAFHPHVSASQQKKMVAISSSAGSVSTPPWDTSFYWYDMSKAALNRLMVDLAADLRGDGITVVMFHPGFVNVEKIAHLDLPGTIPTTTAVGNMIRTIGAITIDDTGRFLQNDGKPQPW